MVVRQEVEIGKDQALYGFEFSPKSSWKTLEGCMQGYDIIWSAF